MYCTYDLMRTSDLPILQSSNLPYDLVPYGSNALYFSLCGLLYPCTTYMDFFLWNLPTVLGVIPTVSNYHNIVVTEDAFPQYLYHLHSNFLKARNFDSLLLLLVKMSAGLTFPSIFLM